MARNVWASRKAGIIFPSYAQTFLILNGLMQLLPYEGPINARPNSLLMNRLVIAVQQLAVDVKNHF
jgi:hypothetical protein